MVAVSFRSEFAVRRDDVSEQTLYRRSVKLCFNLVGSADKIIY